MGSDIYYDEDSKIYDLFRSELFINMDNLIVWDGIIIDKWSNIILSKEIGLEYVLGYDGDYYKIVDEKKWMLAKIKYGI